MTRFACPIAAAALFAAGCATTPPADPNLVPVPVFAAEEAPCEYEVIRRVSIRNPPSPTFEAYVREVRERLGREGAAVGADAVIARLPQATDRARRREVGSGGLPASAMQGPEGQAVRFIPGTCG